MFKKIKSHANIFYQLIKTDWLIIRRDFVGNVIDSAVWITGLTIVFAYIFIYWNAKNVWSFLFSWKFARLGIFFS